MTFSDKQKTFFPRRSELLARRTAAEIAFADRLRSAGVRFIEQKGFFAGDYYCICDFYIPRPARTVVEIDGGYHSDPKQAARDRRKDAYLRSRGFKVVRVRNEQVSDFDLTPLLKRQASRK